MQTANDKTVRQPPRMPNPLRWYFASRFLEPAIAAIGVGVFFAVLSLVGPSKVAFVWAFIACLAVVAVAGPAGVKRDSFYREPVTDRELAWMADILAHELDDYRYYVTVEADSRRGIDRALVLDVAREFRRRMDNGAIPCIRPLTEPQVREGLGQPDKGPHAADHWTSA